MIVLIHHHDYGLRDPRIFGIGVGARDPLTFGGRGVLLEEGEGAGTELEGEGEDVGVTEGSGIS